MTGAVPGDVDAIAELEQRVAGISRTGDYRYLIDNEAGIWHTVVALDEHDQVSGFLASICPPAIPN